MRRWLAACLLLVPALGLAAPEVRLPPVYRTTLANGMRLVVAEHHELPLFAVTVFVGAGTAQDPPELLGLAQLTAETLLRGAGAWDAPALARAVEDLGGTLDAVAGYDATILSGDFLAEDLDAGIAILRAVLREPRLARGEVRRARDELLGQLSADLEDPSTVANQCLGALLYGAHPYGRPPRGTPETLAEAGARDVSRFYSRWYHPNNIVISLVGDVRADRAIERLRAAFVDWPQRPDAVPVRSGPPAPLTGRRVLLVDKPDASQSQIRLGGVALRRADPDLLAAQVTNTILGGGFSSILIDELRVQRSLTYGAYSGYSARLTGGDFRVTTSTKTDTTLAALDLALTLTDRFRTAAPAPAALTKAKAFVGGQFARQVETAGALAQRLAEIEFFGLPQDELSTYLTRVEALDAARAHQVVARVQPPTDAMAIVVLGKAAALRAPLEAKFGPVRVVEPEACGRLAAAR
ncbi:MAG TPA: pitrilysin family protein [Candidatus Limnocylindria bacterium]|nr:pitrilysin family protein [Candidatus Limnocylindria bacterium]